MDTEQPTMVTLLGGPIQFRIPIYQRTYDWAVQNIRQLYDDVVAVGRAKKERYHFIGAITCVRLEKRISDNVTKYLVIDGQQRITSLMLLLRALREVHGGTPKIKDSMINRLLFNENEERDGPYYKMVMLCEDDRAFREIMDKGSTSESGKVATNFGHFVEWLRGEDADSVWYGIKALSSVVIKLEDKDDAQAIFESMNSTGLDLSETDMMQNYMLVANDTGWQKKIYEQYWRPMEQLLGGKDSSDFDEFLRSYLIMRRSVSIPKKKVYREFKAYMNGRDRETEIRGMLRYSEYYAEIIGIPGYRHALSREIANIRNQDTNVANPLLLKVLADFDDGKVSVKDAKNVLRLVDSYLLRSYVYDTHKNANKIFPALIPEMVSDGYAKNLERALMVKTANRFPRDAPFKKSLAGFPLYRSSAVCKYILVRLAEGRGRGRLDPDSFEIEHIMPQNLSSEWKDELGEAWSETHELYLHTIGNLTLTDKNQEMGNDKFADKKETYKNSMIRMTRELADSERWNGDAIRKRTELLVEKAVDLWKCPKGYDEDGPEADDAEDEYLDSADPDTRTLWHGLKKAIEASCTGMRFHMTRTYGAYTLPVGTGERGICALEARRTKIHLTYNTKIGDGVITPSGFVSDISGKGHHAVGDLRSTITSKNDIGKAVGLVRDVWDSKLEDRVPA